MTIGHGMRMMFVLRINFGINFRRGADVLVFFFTHFIGKVEVFEVFFSEEM